MGSSPQVRGTLTIRQTTRKQRGLIPAGAGNIGSPTPVTLSIWAHPRRCGEHRCFFRVLETEQGSSPQVRGTFAPLFHVRDEGGGSSPQVRGTFKTSKLLVAGGGLIPAGAGNILSDMGFYPHTSSFSISLKPIVYFQEYTICSYLRRETRLYRLALLHPFRGPKPFLGVAGRIISLTPSKSTGSHG